MAIMIERAEDIAQNFQNGFSETELLPGTYPGIQNYKCFLKAGTKLTLRAYDKIEKALLYVFSRGRGYVTTEKGAFNIEELSFFMPGVLGESYEIFALEDMEFLRLEYTMTEKDKERYHGWSVRYPFFQKISTCVEYVQDCKGPNTHSWSVLHPKECGRIMMGVVRGVGEGTVEKGHAAVAQWNYALPGSDFTLTVDNESTQQKDGDWSFVPAGLDHSLVAAPGKLAYYIWFEHFVNDFQ